MQRRRRFNLRIYSSFKEMSGNFLRTYEADLQDRVPGIRRKIGIHALLNAMRSRTLQRNYALQAPRVPAINIHGDVSEARVAGNAAWDNALFKLFRQYPGPGLIAWDLPTDGWPLRFGFFNGAQFVPWDSPRNPTNYWVSMVMKRLGMYFRAAIARARKRLQNRYLENYSSGNPLVDLF